MPHRKHYSDKGYSDLCVFTVHLRRICPHAVTRIPKGFPEVGRVRYRKVSVGRHRWHRCGVISAYTKGSYHKNGLDLDLDCWLGVTLATPRRNVKSVLQVVLILDRNGEKAKLAPWCLLNKHAVSTYCVSCTYTVCRL